MTTVIYIYVLHCAARLMVIVLAPWSGCPGSISAWCQISQIWEPLFKSWPGCHIVAKVGREANCQFITSSSNKAKKLVVTILRQLQNARTIWSNQSTMYRYMVNTTHVRVHNVHCYVVHWHVPAHGYVLLCQMYWYNCTRLCFTLSHVHGIGNSFKIQVAMYR